MDPSYRVFGVDEASLDEEALLKHLRGSGHEVLGRFRSDQDGWFEAELEFRPDLDVLRLQRFLATEDGIRHELNTWAAWLESKEGHPSQSWLMDHLIRTRQVITLEPGSPGDALERCCLTLCLYLAQATAGVYHREGQGFFTPDGRLLLADDDQ